MHFVVTHGMCHGAWVWYKLKPKIEAAGHQFTTVDLAACGANPKKLEEVRSLNDYTSPLLDVLTSLPPDEKVVLVGHSGGGIAAAVAMEKYPSKISLAIFLTGIMPDTEHGPSYALDQTRDDFVLLRVVNNSTVWGKVMQPNDFAFTMSKDLADDYYAGGTPVDAWKDTQFSVYGDPNEPLTSLIVGPKFLKSTLYQLCPIEDFTLATLSVRPGSLFMEDLHKIKKFTNDGFGSVTRVYVVCEQDKCIPPEFQRWMIENNPVKEVRVIKTADHMPMFSAPDELCQCLLEVAANYI